MLKGRKANFVLGTYGYGIALFSCLAPNPQGDPEGLTVSIPYIFQAYHGQ